MFFHIKENFFKYILITIYLLLLPLAIPKMLYQEQPHMFSLLFFTPLILILVENIKILFFVFFCSLSFMYPSVGDISLAHILLIFLCVSYIAFIIKEKKVEIPWTVEEKMIFVFFFFCCFSIIQTVHIPPNYVLFEERKFVQLPYIRSLGQIFIWGLMVLSYIFTFRFCYSHNQFFQKIIRGYGIITTLICLSGIFLFVIYFVMHKNFVWFGRPLLYTTTGALKLPRFQGLIQEPAILAHFLSPGLLYWFIESFRKQKHKWFILSCLLVNLIGLFLTFSRAGVLALLMIILIMTIFVFFKKEVIYRSMFKKLITGIFLVSFIIGLTFFFLPSEIKDNTKLVLKERVALILKGEDFSFIQKKEDILMALRVIKVYPLGVGLGNLWYHSPYFRNYIPYITETFGWGVAVSSNFFLFIAAEIGLLGFFVFLAFLILLLYRLCKSFYKINDPEISAMFLWGILSIISMIIQYQFTPILWFHFFFVLGLSSAMYYKFLKD